jgi:hypothetical protein
MDLSSLTKYACFGEGMMCPVKNRDDNIQRWVKFGDIMERLKRLSKISTEMDTVLIRINKPHGDIDWSYVISVWRQQLRACIGDING